jgi:signal transduction histidine kinase
MISSGENTFPDKLKTIPSVELRFLLETLTAQLPADLTCIYEYRMGVSGAQHSTDAIVTESFGTLTKASADRACKLMFTQVPAVLAADEPQILSFEPVEGMKVEQALLYPFRITDAISGVLALFSTNEEAYTPADFERCATVVSLIHGVLENHHLYNVLALNLKTAQSILQTAQAVAEDPSPQHVVNILRDMLFEPHVSSCAMLLYGPVREDSPNGPFEYLEMRGSWSRRHGSGIGIGVRLYLKDYPDLLEQLETHEIVTFPSVNQIKNRFDPLVRGFLKTERMSSLTLIALHSSRQRLGVLAIGTDRKYQFDDRELQSYRTAGEFLTISAMAQLFQQQRERMEQNRAALLDAVTDGVVMVMPYGQGGHVLTVNKRFSRMFEVKEKHAEGDTLIHLLGQMQLPEGVRQELRASWLSTPVRDPAVRRGEFRMVNTEGQPLDVEWYSAPVYQDSHVLGRIYTFHDATPERTAERLRAAFLSRISHELRTPLTSIRGFAEFILEATGDKLPDLAREYTEIILDSAKHLNTLFTDMIEITRADAGELKLNKTEAHLPDVIIGVVARLELQYKARKQQVVMDLDDNLPLVSVDIDRISQVLTNLLTNAIKYSPEGGKIRVETQMLNRTDTLPDNSPIDIVLPAILVTVTDTGKGLDPDDAEKVFMPFYRTEDAKANRIEGVGLGLAVTRSIVEVHRGKIWAVPLTRAKGGCFMFTIPTVRA